MVRTDLCLDNDASRAELTEIAIRLDAASAAADCALASSRLLVRAGYEVYDLGWHAA